MHLVVPSYTLEAKAEDLLNATEYSKEVSLILFNSMKQEAFFLEAFNGKQDVLKNAVYQFKSTVEVSLNELETVGGYKEDKFLLNSAKNILLFYQLEIEDAQIGIDYYIKMEVFNTTKDAFEAIKEKERTQNDVDQFNKAVNELNWAVELYAVMKERNAKLRANLVDEWNNALDKFTDKYAP